MSADGSVPVWIKAQLQSFLGYPDDGQLTNHLLNFTNRAQLLEYCAEMMGADAKVAAFAAELWRRKGGDPTSAASAAAAAAPSAPSKRRDDGDLYGSSAPSTSSAALKQKHSAPLPSASAAPQPQPVSSSSSMSSGQAAAASMDLGRNVKVKIVSSKQQAGQHGSGSSGRARTRCLCQAVTHPLFSNCTACGKVVCEAEGDGPCFYCGSLVTQQGTFPSEQFQRHMRQLATLAEDSPAGKAVAAAAAAKAKEVANTEEEEKKSGAPASSSSTAAAAADAAGLAAAEAQRDKLLNYAKSDTHKTRVYDDQSDWYEFESNAWLSPEERAKKKAATEKALLDLEKRRAHTLTIDLQGGRVVTHSSDAWEQTLQGSLHDAQPKWTDEVAPGDGGDGADGSHGTFMAQAFASNPQLQRSVEEMKFISTSQYYANDTLTGRAKEVYDMLKQSLRPQANPNDRPDTRLHGKADLPSNPLLSSLAKTQRRGESKVIGDGDDAVGAVTGSINDLRLDERLSASRCQRVAASNNCSNDEDEPSCGAAAPSNDSAFSDESDRGVTLSLWQPWASLMVLGIKRFEGRGWYSSHRGRLWIASASRDVDPAEVAQVEAEYRAVYGPHAKIPFPADYPVSALLGCVDMNACWSNEEFQSHRAANPSVTEDSASAFVFVCSNPRVLPVAQSISGAHKLWNLPPRLHEGIKTTLKPVSERWRTSLLPSAASGAPADATGGFDLWPSSMRPASLSSASSLSGATRPSISSLRPGMLLLRQGLSLAQQQAVVDCCRQLGLGAAGFATHAGGTAVKSFPLGLSWNPSTKKYESLNNGGRRVSRVPDLLLDLVSRCLKQASEYLAAHGARNLLPSYVPDVCVVKYFAPSARVEAQQDRDETPASIQAGYPVISFSIGDSAAIVYGDEAKATAASAGAGGKAKGAAGAAGGFTEATLASGDVLMFGGPSRLVYHGVDRILAQTKPRDLFLKPGRLEVSFRKL